MPEVTLKINNRGYSLSCETGQEQRLVDLSHYVDQRLSEISSSGAATHDAHLLVLTSLVLADEIYELREQVTALKARTSSANLSGAAIDDEAEVVKAIDHLTAKIERISTRIHPAEDSAAA